MTNAARRPLFPTTSEQTAPAWNGTDVWSSIQDATNNTYRCVRSVRGDSAGATSDDQYCEWVTGEVEFFDLVQDPYQLRNLAPEMPSALVTVFRKKLELLATCAGALNCSLALGLL